MAGNYMVKIYCLFLKNEVTLATFHSSGTVPDCRDLSGKMISGLTNSDFPSFKMRGEIVSGAGDVLTLSLIDTF